MIDTVDGSESFTSKLKHRLTLLKLIPGTQHLRIGRSDLLPAEFEAGLCGGIGG